jgi:hypothetical protein
MTLRTKGNGVPDGVGADFPAPHERLRELTAILANGIHRLRSIPPALPECGQILSESTPSGVAPGAPTRPDGAVLTRDESGDR